MLKSYDICDIGLKRKVNEDSFFVDEENNFVVVSDGMGGYEKGEVASLIVVEEFNKKLTEFHNLTNNIQTKQLLCEYLNEANEQASKVISLYAKQNKIDKTIGATVVGFYYLENVKKIVLFHIGDSRIYKIKSDNIEQLTNDHSVSNNVLSKAIGNFNIFDLEINFIDFEYSDIFLVCSDGVYNCISNQELLFMIKNNSLDKSCQKIKDIIYKNGAKDNLTLVVATIEEN
jgi:protein phosphatase